MKLEEQIVACLVYILLFQVPSLEHNNEVKVESLDLIKYIDSNFEGPSLMPDVSFCLNLHDNNG